jgi:hypothetical protein
MQFSVPPVAETTIDLDILTEFCLVVDPISGRLLQVSTMLPLPVPSIPDRQSSFAAAICLIFPRVSVMSCQALFHH